MNFSPKQRLILFAFLAFIFIFLLFFLVRRPTISPPPPLRSLAEIKPGQTQFSQLSKLPSYHQEGNSQQGTLYFGQNAPQKYSEAIIKDGLVVAYRQTNPAFFRFSALSEYLSNYGSPTQTIETELSQYGFVGHLFAPEGLLVFAHQANEEILEEWLLPPHPSSELIFSLFPPLNSDGH